MNLEQEIKKKIKNVSIDNNLLFELIKNVYTQTKNTAKNKQIWKEKNIANPSIFSDTELLFFSKNEGIICLGASNETIFKFLINSYSVEDQNFIEKIFGERKTIIVINKQDWKLKKENSRSVILFKSKEEIENSIFEWLIEIDEQQKKDF